MKLHSIIFFTFLIIGLKNMCAEVHVIGWQTFDLSNNSNQFSGISDNSPDTNSTYDLNPAGSHFESKYLSGAIGESASNDGYSGLGEATWSGFSDLNDATFGSNLNITDYTLSDGTNGQRIGANPNDGGTSGWSVWKFSSANSSDELIGDFSITNNSSYYFRLDGIHFDANGMNDWSSLNSANYDGPNNLELSYLATPGNLLYALTNPQRSQYTILNEISNQTLLYSNTWTTASVENVSLDIPLSLNTNNNLCAVLAPGQSASFRFSWSGGNIGDAHIDNLALSGTFINQDDEYAVVNPLDQDSQPNIIVIIPDDHRWDATSFMQERIESLGRTARFPWLNGTTPNIDRLSQEGAHFDNGFAVYSLCSPARATMLTGVYPHIHGITNNSTYFPADSISYARILQDAGYATGYFGKWHMGRQEDRPGFEDVATFYGQGSYFGTAFYDGNSNLRKQSSSEEWVDDVSTDFALDFIDSKVASQQPFVMVLGFKTPHSPWEPPNRTSLYYNGETLVPVPNLGIPPPGQNDVGNNGSASTLDYMRTIAGIDANVGRVLQKLDDLSITNNTAVIYISDNGFFRGEHQLGDKRAPYEESIRLPFMIRYPAIQPNNSGLISDGIALNLDIAPTILDIAGVPIPEHMQGTSLLPLVRGENPSNWRQSFFYQYNHDPEFPTARVRPYIALRHENGFKIVKYEEDKNWNEIYNTSTSDDPYEINNLINDPSYLSNKNEMENLLNTAMHNTNFLRSLKFDIQNTGGKKMIQAGATYNFKLQTSSDLVNWGNIDQFSGEGETELNLVKDSSYDSMNTIYSDYSDYMIIENNNSAANLTGNTIAIGSYASWEGVPNAGGRNAVLIFQIPPIPNGDYLAFTELEITAMKRYQPGFKCDLYSLGIHDAQAFPIIDYNEGEDDSNRKIIGGFFDASVGNDGAKVYSSIISTLTILINDFYGANPNYNGGKYLFLRLSPSYDPQQLAHKFLVYSSNETDTSRKPKLKLYFKETSNIDPKYFYRISYGNQ